MIKEDRTGRRVLSYESVGRIERLPAVKTGVSRSGNEWRLGPCLLEVYGDDRSQSARLFLTTFDEFLIEQVHAIGVGKEVRVRWHVDVREHYDSYMVSLVLDEVHGMTDAEDFVYGTGKEVRGGCD